METYFAFKDALNFLRKTAEKILAQREDRGYIEASERSHSEGQKYVDELICIHFGSQDLNAIAEKTYELFHGEKEAEATRKRMGLSEKERRKVYPNYGENALFQNQEDLQRYSGKNQSFSIENGVESKFAENEKEGSLVLKGGEVKNLLSPVDNRPQQDSASIMLERIFRPMPRYKRHTCQCSDGDLFCIQRRIECAFDQDEDQTGASKGVY